MTDRGDEPAASEPGRMPGRSEWDWFDEDYPNGIRLMFVRGVMPERVIEAFGADPAAAELLTAEATELTLGHPWVRAGRAGGWAFAVDNWWEVSVYGEFGKLREDLTELSRRTELALLVTGMGLDEFFYIVDGVEVTSFEPLLSAWRNGSDPDRFVPQMRQAGLRVDPPPYHGDAELARSPSVAVLEMLNLALGIRLTREVAMGPLPTVQPGPPA
jgi:hypothetical protein